ncbi:MAG: PspC domain-containing protein [Mycobacteriales bacterium]
MGSGAAVRFGRVIRLYRAAHSGGGLGARPSKELTMEPTRKLYRSRKDRKLAGVCGGLAEYLNTDPTVIRVLFVVLAVLGGAGALIYLAMWLIVPEQP